MLLDSRSQRLFACDCAESCIINIADDAKYEFLQIISVIRNYENGAATKDELIEAKNCILRYEITAGWRALWQAACTIESDAAWESSGIAEWHLRTQSQTEMLLKYHEQLT